MALHSTIHTDSGTFIIEEHAGEMYAGLRFSLDERVTQDDGTKVLLNIGWYRTLEGARHALMLASQPTEEIIRDINTGPAA